MPEIAENLHAALHAPHLMHFAGSMWNGFLISPEIAPTGHFFAQAEQPLHFDAIISGNASALHCPAGQRFSLTWIRYSSRKCFRVERTGFGAVLPSPQREPI